MRKFFIYFRIKNAPKTMTMINMKNPSSTMIENRMH